MSNVVFTLKSIKIKYTHIEKPFPFFGRHVPLILHQRYIYIYIYTKTCEQINTTKTTQPKRTLLYYIYTHTHIFIGMSKPRPRYINKQKQFGSDARNMHE